MNAREAHSAPSIHSACWNGCIGPDWLAAEHSRVSANKAMSCEGTAGKVPNSGCRGSLVPFVARNTLNSRDEFELQWESRTCLLYLILK